jgi:hypothetical protein
MIDPETALAFSLYENPSVYALLVGSGVSRSAQIPTGWEITLDLVRRVARLQGIEDQPDWNQWHLDTYGDEPNYAKLIDEVAPTPDERRSILHSYIEPRPDDASDGLRAPTEAHRAIARLVKLGFIRVIITTNFDPLIERALREIGIEPTVIASDDDLKGAVPLIHSKCYVLKVHGDYLDTRIRNTPTELANYSKPFNAFLDRVLDEHGLIICGWSGDWDPALCAAITRAPNRRYPMFWAVRGTLTDRAMQLASKRGGRIVPIVDADTFFGTLAEKVSLQIELQQPDPQSVDLLVAATKRYLEHAESRILLHDLIGQQARLLGDRLPSTDDLNQMGSHKDFVRWVSRTEAALQPMARIFGVLGRWGGDSEAALALRLVESFALQPSANGLTHLLALRSYPAMILAYAFGLGAYAAGDLSKVNQLFSLNLAPNESDPETFLSSLFLERWGGSRGNPWLALPEFGGHAQQAMLSAHLHVTFSAWTKDYLFGPREFDSTFHGFELLASLTSVISNGSKENLVAALADSQGGNWVPTPLGRVMWDEATRNRLLRQWSAPEGNAALLGVGLAERDAEHLDLAIRHLRQQIERRRIFP